MLPSPSLTWNTNDSLSHRSHNISRPGATATTGAIKIDTQVVTPVHKSKTKLGLFLKVLGKRFLEACGVGWPGLINID